MEVEVVGRIWYGITISSFGEDCITKSMDASGIGCRRLNRQSNGSTVQESLIAYRLCECRVRDKIDSQ